MDERFTTYAPERDIYQLLQVDPRADTETIVAACRRLARHYHPDYNGSPRATEEMQVVNSVRAVMTDPAARARYDRARERWLANQAVARWPSARPARPARDAAPPARHERAPRRPPTAAAGVSPGDAWRQRPDAADSPGRHAERAPEPVRAIVATPVEDPFDRGPTLFEKFDVTVTPRLRRFGLTLRAVALGVRAGLVALAPSRCGACRAAIGPRDVRCETCGVSFLETTARR